MTVLIARTTAKTTHAERSYRSQTRKRHIQRSRRVNVILKPQWLPRIVSAIGVAVFLKMCMADTDRQDTPPFKFTETPSTVCMVCSVSEKSTSVCPYVRVLLIVYPDQQFWRAGNFCGKKREQETLLSPTGRAQHRVIETQYTICSYRTQFLSGTVNRKTIWHSLPLPLAF